MDRRHLVLVALVAGGISAAAGVAPVAQERAWTTPRTAWGDPDLQGTWTNETITPLERPATLADKAFLTEEEAIAVEQRTAAQRAGADDRTPRGGVGNYNQFWLDSGSRVVSTRRTSLVIDPPNGRVPVRPEAERRRDEDEKRIEDAPDFMSPWDRCITRGIPGGMFPAGYNNAYQIMQAPGMVVIFYEMIHEARIIPTDNRPHAPAHLRFWDGDSVGRWEGDTLVVDVTNYNGRGWIATNAAAGRIKGIPQSEQLHVVERFRRVDADTILYQVTIDDPPIYTQPWTVEIPLERNDEYRIYEYACHEGNRAIENILRAGRAQQNGR
jgi:hypothetical protein